MFLLNASNHMGATICARPPSTAGVIPEWLKALSRLEELWLQGNQLTGTYARQHGAQGAELGAASSLSSWDACCRRLSRVRLGGAALRYKSSVL